MKDIEQVLDSREVAEMVEKNHNELLKDIRRYMKQFNEGKIPHVDFLRKVSIQTPKERQGRVICSQRKAVSS